jgi:hypothetical protein
MPPEATIARGQLSPHPNDDANYSIRLSFPFRPTPARGPKSGALAGLRPRNLAVTAGMRSVCSLLGRLAVAKGHFGELAPP